MSKDGVTMPSPTHLPPQRQGAGPAATWPHRLLLIAIATLTLASAQAQVFSAERYLQECLRFEAGGDLTTARQSCLNALEVDRRLVGAELALARIDAASGDVGAAESRLNRIRNQVVGAEPSVLLAEIALAGERYEEAAGLLARARRELAATPDGALSARVAFAQGRLATREGRTDEALTRYAEAITFEPLNVTYRLTDAQLRFRLGDVAGATRQLESYEAISGDTRNADVKALQGRLLWSQGQISAATDQLETALALRGLRDSAPQADDLRVLALLYYAQGDVDSGGIAMREALRRGNLIGQITSNALLWIVALLVLLGLSLVAEGRRAGIDAELASDAPSWTLGEAYGVLIASALVALAASLVYSVLMLGNLLALLTPLQRHDALAVYFIAFALSAAALTWRRLRRAGLDAGSVLLGPSGTLPYAFLVGLGVTGVIAAYLLFVPREGLFGPFPFDLARPTPLVVAALVLLPLAEFAFRGLLQPSLSRRYGSPWTIALMALVWAVAYGTPVLAMLVIGAALAALTRRYPGAFPATAAVAIGWLVLLALSSALPAMRGLFLG